MLDVLTDKYQDSKTGPVTHGVSLFGLNENSLFHTNAGHVSGFLFGDEEPSESGRKSAAKSGFLSSGELSADMSDFDSDAESEEFDTEKYAGQEKTRRVSLIDSAGGQGSNNSNNKKQNKKLNFNEMNVENIRVRSASMFGQNYPKTSSIGRYFAEINSPFRSKFMPSDMRQLALVAHNHMKPAMKSFIESHSEVLKKFRITGTNTTMTMCKTIWGEDNDEIEYGATCVSGPLGGDAQIASLICMEDIGAIFFFIDPLSAHPHQADIDSLVRLANVGNIILCSNPSTGCGMMWMLRQALITGNSAMMTSFFETLESPSVAEYKANQKRALEHAINSGGATTAPKPTPPTPSRRKSKEKKPPAVTHLANLQEENDSDFSEEDFSDDSDSGGGVQLLGLEASKMTIGQNNKKKDNNHEDDADTAERADKLLRSKESMQVNRKRMGGFRAYMENNLQEKANPNRTKYASSIL